MSNTPTLRNSKRQTVNSTDKIANDICQASVEDVAAENRLVFRPPWYLRSGHIQTILTAVVRPKKLVPPAQRGIVDLGIRGSTFVYRNYPSSYRDPKSVPMKPLYCYMDWARVIRDRI